MGDKMLECTDLNGKWQSKKPETIKNQDETTMYIEREASFEDDRWEIIIKTFLDEKCKYPLFKVRATGKFVLDVELKDVKGATCVDFKNTARYVTAENKAVVEMLNHAAVLSRGWEIGVEQDVSEDGCLLVPSVADCPVEYDLLKKDGEKLYFGDYTPEQKEKLQKTAVKKAGETSEGICSPENRPGQLIKYPLLKV
jgi:hypothetical protein